MGCRIHPYNDRHCIYCNSTRTRSATEAMLHNQERQQRQQQKSMTRQRRAQTDAAHARKRSAQKQARSRRRAAQGGGLLWDEKLKLGGGAAILWLLIIIAPFSSGHPIIGIAVIFMSIAAVATATWYLVSRRSTKTRPQRPASQTSNPHQQPGTYGYRGPQFPADWRQPPR